MVTQMKVKAELRSRIVDLLLKHLRNQLNQRAEKHPTVQRNPFVDNWYLKHMQNKLTTTWLIVAILIGAMMALSYLPTEAPSQEVPVSYEQNLDTLESYASEFVPGNSVVLTN
jgi:hypothetical protein